VSSQARWSSARAAKGKQFLLSKEIETKEQTLQAGVARSSLPQQALLHL